MTTDSTQKEETPGRLKDYAVLAAFCVFAVIRITVFGAAFPFFANVDEGLHVDLVLKYSQGHPPRGVETFSRQTGSYLSLYGSPEFLNSPAQTADGHFPPPAWKQGAEMDPALRPPPVEFWLTKYNFDSGQMPLYYVIAGLWTNVGQWIGLEGIGLLYWMRSLNGVFVIAILILGFYAAQSVFPGQRHLQWAVPALLACLPQDAFYQVQNDVLSPLCFGWLFICLVRAFRAAKWSHSLAIHTGIAFAATYLTKTSNLPLLAVVGVLLILQQWQLLRRELLRQNLVPIVLMLLCLLLPVLGWTIWMKRVFGDLTGSSGKMQLLSWTYKSFFDWFTHPIFTPEGAWTFWRGLLASFWRGEFEWHKKPIALPAADLFYVLSSTVLIVVAMVWCWRRKAGAPLQTRFALSLAFASFVACVCFYLLLSVMFDFGTSRYPSREFPFFVSGRLMSGAMIPFALLYVYGLDVLCSLTKRRAFFVSALVVIILITTVSEIVVTRPVFHSEFNWYHL